MLLSQNCLLTTERDKPSLERLTLPGVSGQLLPELCKDLLKKAKPGNPNA
jgi:hypothetical protein